MAGPVESRPDIARHLCRGRRMSRNAEFRIRSLTERRFLKAQTIRNSRLVSEFFVLSQQVSPGNYCAAAADPAATRLPYDPSHDRRRDVSSSLWRASGAARAAVAGAASPWGCFRARQPLYLSAILVPRIVMHHQKSSSFRRRTRARPGSGHPDRHGASFCGPISGRPIASISSFAPCSPVALMVASKVVTVATPYALKWATDALTPNASRDAPPLPTRAHRRRRVDDSLRDHAHPHVADAAGARRAVRVGGDERRAAPRHRSLRPSASACRCAFISSARPAA